MKYIIVAIPTERQPFIGSHPMRVLDAKVFDTIDDAVLYLHPRIYRPDGGAMDIRNGVGIVNMDGEIWRTFILAIEDGLSRTEQDEFASYDLNHDVTLRYLKLASEPGGHRYSFEKLRVNGLITWLGSEHWGISPKGERYLAWLEENMGSEGTK